MGSIRELLKCKTAEKHQSAEHHLKLLLDKNLSAEAYTTTVQRMHHFYEVFESYLHKIKENSLAAKFYLSDRQKLSLLESDLKFLKTSPANHQILSLSAFPSTTPSEHQDAFIWGMLYVIEGSTLGGQVIQRCLMESLSLPAGSGSQFFASYGENTGKMWQRFIAALEESSAAHHAEHSVRGALFAFDLILKTYPERGNLG